MHLIPMCTVLFIHFQNTIKFLTMEEQMSSLNSSLQAQATNVRWPTITSKCTHSSHVYIQLSTYMLDSVKSPCTVWCPAPYIESIGPKSTIQSPGVRSFLSAPSSRAITYKEYTFSASPLFTVQFCLPCGSTFFSSLQPWLPVLLCSCWQ